MLSTTALRHFAEVARSGSLRGAADRVFVVASAVSRQLRLLEEELGTKLFERGRGRTPMRLTPAGEVLLALVKKIEEETDCAQEAIHALRSPQRQTVRLGISESMTRDFIPHFLAAYRTAHPDVDFDVRVNATSTGLELLLQDQVDLVLAFNSPLVAGVRIIYERSLATCVLVSPAHPLAMKETIDIDDCDGYAMVLPDESGDLLRINEESFPRARLRNQKVLQSNSYELLRNSSAAGLGIAIVSEPICDENASARRYIPLKGARPRSFGVFVRQGAETGNVISDFAADLVAQLRRLEAKSRSGKRNKLR